MAKLNPPMSVTDSIVKVWEQNPSFKVILLKEARTMQLFLAGKLLKYSSTVCDANSKEIINWKNNNPTSQARCDSKRI